LEHPTNEKIGKGIDKNTNEEALSHPSPSKRLEAGII
jgi:hypothetical protein